MIKGKARYPWTITLLLSGAALGYVFYMFIPQMRAIGAARQQLSLKHESLAQSSKMTASVALVSEDVASTRHYVKQQETRLVQPSALPQLFGQINQLAKASGAVVTRFEPQPAVRLEQIRKVPVALSLSGNFAAVQRVIAGLESLPTTLWIEDLRIDEVRESGGNTKSDLQLGIFVDNREISD
jgi:Tfp pilus assembly protein PilO